MINEELVEFVKIKLAQGVSRAEIEGVLITQGNWLKADVDQVFDHLDSADISKSSPSLDSSQMIGISGSVEGLVENGAKKPTLMSSRFFLSTVIGVAVLLLGGVAYFFAGDFVKSKFVKADSIDGFLLAFTEGIKNIDRFSYEIEIAAHQEPRDERITPIDLSESTHSAEKIAMVKRDLEKLQNTQDVLYSLRDYHWNNKKYPATLADISLVDPSYSYELSSNGATAFLKTELEATESVSYFANNEGMDVDIDNRTVTIDASVSYFSFPYSVESILPKSSVVRGFEMFSTLVRLLPERFKGDVTFSGMMGIAEKVPDSENSLSANIDWGDLTFRVGADAITKDGGFYGRINNFPSFPFLNIDTIRGQWIKITKQDIEEDIGLAGVVDFNADLSEAFEGNSEEVEKASKIFREALMRHNPLKLKESPRTEKLDDGRSVVKYSLGLNGEKVADFVEYVAEESAKVFFDEGRATGLRADIQGELAYLKSAEFLQVVDYLNKNAEFVVWLDEQKGFPVQLLQKIVYVADPSASEELPFFSVSDGSLNSQLVYSTKVTLSNINKSVDIKAPTEFLTPEDAGNMMSGLYGESLNEAREKAADASVMANINNSRAHAELYYGDNGFTYSGACEDVEVSRWVALARETAKNANVSCYDSVQVWAVEGELIGGGFYCVDSTGNAGTQSSSTISSSDVVCG